MAMEWITLQHLDLHPANSGAKPSQPLSAAFHPSLPLLALSVGNFIIELDALTGCKLASINVGAAAVRMAYSPAGGHVIVAVLEDWTIKSYDLDTDHTYILHTPERKTDKVAGVTVEVHIALTPLQPWLFFGAHGRFSVNVVGTVEGARPATKIKTDVKKPITDLACHPRSPLLYIAYLDGVVRAYNIQTFTLQYVLQIDSSIKLVGAGAFAFHSTLEWVFIADRSGTLLAWDVSVPSRPNMIGITQVGSNPIAAVAWHSLLKLLITLSKEGTVQAWRTRVILNPNRPPMRANFFEPAGVELLDVANILTQQGGTSVYPLPRITDILIHSKLNLVTVLFASIANTHDGQSKGGTLSREARKQLFSVLQSARGSPASVLKEKLAILGSAGILPTHQLQLRLQQAKGHSNQMNLTMSDLARKAFLYNNSLEGQAKSGPMTRLPLLTISEAKVLPRDIPVYQPIQQELKFFNSEQRIFNYPVRVFFMDGCNLTAYNLVSGEYNIYKKLPPTALGGNERHPKHMLYSLKQHLFLIFFECRGANSEVVLYRDPVNLHTNAERDNIITGKDGAFIGIKENQYAILDDDGMGICLYYLEEDSSITSEESLPNGESGGAIDENSFSEVRSMTKGSSQQRGPIQFVFQTPVHRIFSTPLESTVMYVIPGSHIGLVKLQTGIYSPVGDAYELSMKPETGTSLKLRPSETVLQVQWQETLSGRHVAGILTMQRVMITSSKLEILASSGSTFDKGFPAFRSLVWAGPALFFSTATSVAVLGWDGIARLILTVGNPNYALMGCLNDRLLLAYNTESSPRQKQGVEIRNRLVGLLEPLLIGWATMQSTFEPKLDLSEIVYQLTSRFDSLRITPRLLDSLSRGPSVCGDLAVELAQAGPQFTQVLRCKYATAARRFTTALSILKDEFLRSRDYPKCPPTSRLFQRFRELGRACIRYGQFDQAKDTFEVVSDFESMLDLFISHLNPSALRRLAQKLEDANCDPELRRQCEKILGVRSTTWGQGGVFANFAAESMVPKGPEWGGGNWVIKTGQEMKNVPTWELSNEVTAYMKTPNGPIPTIVPDHLGVYLGTMKGRGTVVEVREDALAKRLVPMENVENGVAETIKKLAKSESNKSRSFGDRNPRAASGLGLQALMQATDGGSIVDEQARAEEEFKKFGVDDSSDEEGEVPSTKAKLKIVIRDRPVAGAGVDVHKVKEATQQFRLGAAFPPLNTRTRSQQLGPVQDLINLPSAPSSIQSSTPAPNSATAPVSQSMMMGMGVDAGPIPEDFFQHTTSALGALASFQQGRPLQPGNAFWEPGAVAEPQSSMHASPRVQDNLNISSVGGSMHGTELASVGTDPFAGGVPPQAGDQGYKNLQNNDMALPAISNKTSRTVLPLDLGAFEASGGVISIDTGKAPDRPSSPPAVVRPGQVPRGAPASVCFKTGLAHLEQNQLTDAMSCLDEAFLALAKDQSLGQDIRKQARICAQYKIAVLFLQEIMRLQRVQGPTAVSAKDEMARLARHLSTLPLLAKHRIICIRTAIKRNMDVQNFAFAKSMLDLLVSKAPANKQDELRSLINVCIQRGLTDRSVDSTEDPSQFCAATLGRLPTIGHDICDVCGARFSALASPGCTICGMGTVRRSDSASGPLASPFT